MIRFKLRKYLKIFFHFVSVAKSKKTCYMKEVVLMNTTASSARMC